MPRMTKDFSRYVNARWLPFLVERVLRYSAPSLISVRKYPTKAAPFDYRGVVKVSGLARRIAINDRGGEGASSWTRTIRRWINDRHAPAPETVRRALDALNFDWVIGLGRSGYQQQAIAMLHSLWARGSRSRVAAQARAIFTGSNYQRSVVGDRSIWAFSSTAGRFSSDDAKEALGKLTTESAHARRLREAAEHCWGAKGAVPMRCTPPRDLPASPHLHVAWMLLESAFTSHTGSLEQRLGAVEESVVREVQIWADAITPHEARLVKVRHRRKVHK